MGRMVIFRSSVWPKLAALTIVLAVLWAFSPVPQVRAEEPPPIAWADQFGGVPNIVVNGVAVDRPGQCLCCWRDKRHPLGRDLGRPCWRDKWRPTGTDLWRPG